ncbi:IPT/TIG domain-containing protein [Sorangium cellulosum]|uniref:IPT/TIG domain-containing protein n=1 Tax=Sorangium cellulosum So0157-2 TaxID=1254432 RepID=S4XT73_SORCE|nr:IPT/TIG domain-containing protein [Sorangium cellulosum]AGP36377.1 hypothetical protein SCE1572_18895 [Sorangium cellulosum So0157-2]
MRTASRRFLPARFAPICAGLAVVSACVATAPSGIRRQTDGDGGGGGDFGVDPQTTSSSASTGLPDADPHALLGADPTHGPFNGGQRVLLHGNGFSSKVRVWFGDVEVDPSAIVPIDPSRVQVVAPPGAAGPVELAAQNGDDASTRRSLPGGYVYDALYASPSSGPISGGTTIELVGQGTRWDATTVARIGQKPCTSLAVLEPTRLACTVPQGTPGAKTISVTTGDETILVLDGYTYEDSQNGYKGGLSGGPLAGRLKVLVYNNFTGDPIPGARVVVGSSLSSALLGEADASGVAVFEDASLDAPRTVTVAATCHSPISFASVPVDTVTVYLDPVLTPACGASGEPPPPVGGKVGSAAVLDGELVWDTTLDPGAAAWGNIPSPQRETERKAAYVFTTGADPLATFQLPPEYQAITPDTPGELGHAFTMYLAPGNRSIYALAGLEDRSTDPPRFTAYAMGIVRGIPLLPNRVTTDVFVRIDQPLDHALTMEVTAPAKGPKGPDRIKANVSLMIGNDGFATLPAGAQSPLIPFDGRLSFVGVPPLNRDLLGASYHSSARAVTGQAGLAPLSVVGRALSTTTSAPVRIGDFVGVPTLETPAQNGAWDGAHLATSFAAGAPVDLSVYDIASGSGLIRWTVAVPAGSHAVELPDIRQLGLDHGALPPGPVTIGVYGARIDGFDYGKLVYRQLTPQGMAAYSLDSFSAHL